MRVYKCNECQVVIDPKTTAYYEINEITHHAKEGKGYRLVLNSAEGEETVERAESWCQYTDIDFCVACFEKTGFKKYLV